MTSAVGQYIESYDVNKFLRLTPRQQNKLLYQYFKCKDEKARNSAKCQKSKYLKKIIVTPKVKPSPKRNPPTQSKTPITHSAPDETGVVGHSASGGLRKLTEEILENALVIALETDPTRALGPALAFLDKKKSLSIEDTDTNTSIIALDKMERKRKEMFT